MTVKDFIPVSDAKLTIEKEVKPKPKIEELTIVESPGNPVSATFLEKRGGVKRKKINRLSKKGNAVLIITEKPQAAKKIAESLGNPKKHNEYGALYYELFRDGRRIIIVSAVGHLFNLTYSKGQRGWPIFDIEWQPSFKRKEAAFTKRYYELIKELSNEAGEFIVATDFDIEGEVIGWNVLRFICKQKNAKRMKFSTLTAAELEKSYVNAMPELAWGNAYAGETRHILDWLYGINLSRALMSAIKKVGSFRILSIGRVQGPALKIIVDREREIENFKPEPFWQVFAYSNGIEFKHPEDIFEKKQLDRFKKLKEGLAETTKTEEKIPPPPPFDLTTLQREAYRWHKISPSETLRIAQKLYLGGLISYPRTSSQKIPKEIEPKKILKRLGTHFPEALEAERERPVEGKKTDPAHPSIYPTGEFAKLSANEQRLYNLIVKRFISVFSKDVITLNKKIVLSCGDIKFNAYGLEILEKGWAKVYPSSIEESIIPDLNGKVKIEEIKIEDKETQPPKRYTPASLIAVLEKKNLGTKATRSMIVDTLFERGYLEGTSIKATKLGIKLIESLEKHSPIIIDENLTRTMEEEIEKMQESNRDFEIKEKKVISKAKEIISKIAEQFKLEETEIGKELSQGLQELRQNQEEANILMLCPLCKKGNLRIMYSKKNKRYFVACSSYPECKQTYSLPPNSLIKKSDKVCEADNFPKLLAIRKGKRPWEFCFNPECPIEKEKKKKLEE